MASSQFSAHDLGLAKEFACDRFGVKSLKSHQSNALDHFLRGEDVFVSLPTGYGKSLIFQAAPLCLDFLCDDGDVPKSLAIVVVPLKALALNLVERCAAFGLKTTTAIAEISDQLLEDASTGKYDLIFANPEALFSGNGREFLQVESIYNRLCGLFVDESHCVTKCGGQSSGKTTAFRKMYGEMGTLRSRLKLNLPVIALTATASSSTRKAVVESLEMHNTALVQASPVRRNIKHSIMPTKVRDGEQIFHWLAMEILSKGEGTERVIVYCQSRKSCAELYSIFCDCIPKSMHLDFNMFHTNTQSQMQEEILKDFSDPQGVIRVLFATIAFGLGVDVKGVQNVIMYGTPTDIDDYVQLSGRAGRDGTQSVSVLVKCPLSGGKPLTKAMTTFVTSETCRREVLKAVFPISEDDSSSVTITAHNCCDICAGKCSCAGDHCSETPGFVESNLQATLSPEPSGSEVQIQFVTDEVQEQVKNYLLQLREELIGSNLPEHVYNGHDIACGLSIDTINKIVGDLHFAFSYTQFHYRYTFATQEIAENIWGILNKIPRPLCASRVDVGDSSTSSSNSEPFDEYREPAVLFSDADD